MPFSKQIETFMPVVSEAFHIWQADLHISLLHNNIGIFHHVITESTSGNSRCAARKIRNPPPL